MGKGCLKDFSCAHTENLGELKWLYHKEDNHLLISVYLQETAA